MDSAYDISNVDYKQLFIDLPHRHVVLKADAPKFTMLTGNKGYLEVTGKTIGEIVGKGLFEVFPDTSERAVKKGKGELQLSFEKVIKTKEPDSTGVIRYDIPGPDGELEVRYWQATHYPWLDGNGICQAIIQSTADITEMVQSSEKLRLAEVRLDDALATGLVELQQA